MELKVPLFAFYMYRNTIFTDQLINSIVKVHP